MQAAFGGRSVCVEVVRDDVSLAPTNHGAVYDERERPNNGAQKRTSSMPASIAPGTSSIVALSISSVLEATRPCESRALVLRGEAGIGGILPMPLNPVEQRLTAGARSIRRSSTATASAGLSRCKARTQARARG